MKQSNQDIKVLYFVPEPMPTYRADVAVLFGKYLPREGVRADLVGRQGQGEVTQQGFASVTVPGQGRGRLWREAAYVWHCLRSILGAKRGQYAMVQVRDMVGIGALALILARIKGIRFAYWMSFLMNEGRIGRARAEIAKGGGLRYRLVLLKGLIEVFLLDRFVLPNADHVFVQSEAMRDLIAGRGVAREKMTPVPMGVDCESLQGAAITPTRLPGWQGLPVIGYLGTLDRSREMERVVDMLALVRRTVPACRLLLIGDSPTPSDLDDLRAYARQQGQEEAVHITGWMAAAQAWPLLAACDLAVSYIPRGDLFDISSPTKPLEYLALAMPCVGNDTPDQVLVLQGSQAGWLCASSVEAMAQAMLEILHDPQAARARAAHGPAWVQAQRSYAVLARQLAAAYQQLSRN
ncbi:glycosyltransferase [Massilia sp. W12]|uniref:glycosyltransferase n=1 Tax=Massilia sp. W12 TaxID=3126507 RepID=UPI0030CEA73D